MKIVTAGVIAMLLLGVVAVGAEDYEPGPGVLVASVGNAVVVADPLGSWRRDFAAGPVAWLFPAPGGRLFAPDLVGGTTTTIDLRSMTVVERLDGISMPWFGEQPDRYIAVSNELLLMSYPERAILASVPVTIERPWQVDLTANDTYVVVLERDPGGGPTAMTIADLAEGRVVFRHATGGEVLHFGVLPGGVFALADAAALRIRLVRAATLETVAQPDPGGRPVDVVVTDGGRELIAAATTMTGAGRLTRWRIRAGKHGLEATLKDAASLSAPPLRLALSPDGRRVAVATADGIVTVREARSLETVATIELGGEPRDLRWCDPTRKGPALAEWSDQAPPGGLDEHRLEGHQ